jgi:hypothetical protein
MAAKTAKTLRYACLIAAACLYGCATAEQPKPAMEPEKPAEAPAPAMAQPEKPVEAPAPLIEAPQAAPAAPKAARKAPKRKAPVRKAAPPPPPPVAAVPPPPVAVPPTPSPEQERARRRDEYIAALQKSVVTFKPPSPIQVGQHAVAPLSVDLPKEAAQLADDLRKSLAENAAAWTPRMRAQLAGADFDIAPAEGSDPSGAKDLSMTGRTEWSWGIVPKVAGTKQLTARLTILLPPGLGEPIALPAVARSVEVEATLSSSIGRYWDDYWQWIVGVLAVAVIAIAWWARKRGG